MHDAGLGLTGLSTEELEKLLRLIHHGELSCPIARSTLMEVGGLVGMQYSHHGSGRICNIVPASRSNHLLEWRPQFIFSFAGSDPLESNQEKASS